MPDIDKQIYSLRMPRTLYRRLVRLAEKRCETVKETVLSLLNKETNNITLNEDDYKIIAKETRQAAEKYGRRFSLTQSKNAPGADQKA